LTEHFWQGERSGFLSKTIVVDTPLGAVAVRNNWPPGSMGDLKLEEGLGRFAHYSSIIHNVEAFEVIASRDGGRVTLAVAEPNLIVAYGLCYYPDSDERWSGLGDLMYEMAAVEVSRNYRNFAIGRKVMDLVMDDDFFEDKIVYMTGFSWHWDLEGSGLTPAQYRQKMIRLYSTYGFREVYTNEPNIALRAENLMMIRVGSRVSAEDQRRFRYLRFGIKQPK